MHKSNTILLLLTRSPELGKVKTRLIPDLGEEGATNAHRELLSHTLNTINQCEFLDKQLWLKGKQDVFKACFQQSFMLYEQTSNDLGKNMFEAARQALLEYRQVIIIGSDCPGLSVNDIQRAVAELKNGSDLVIGPAEDGGYYLIGFNKLHDELFSDIEWGTDKVFHSTLKRSKELSLVVSTLSTHYDVDTVKDYARFKC